MISPPSASRTEADVLVLGGGIAGLALARHLLRESPKLRVVVVDRGPLPVDSTRSKVGESCTEASSWYLADRLGLRDHLEGRQIKKLGLRFFLPGGGGFGGRPEFGLMTPGVESFSLPFAGINPTTWQVHRGRLEATMLEDLRAAGAILRPESRAAVRLGAPHRVDIEGSAGMERWLAKWVVDASGGAGALPGGDEERATSGHQAQAAWFWVADRLDPDTFSDDPAFLGRMPRDLRWRSTNHLVGAGYWIWLIALADGQTSVGVVTDPARHPAESFREAAGCANWLAAHEPELAAALRARDWSGYTFRGWESHARRTLVSGERWAVAGDTAAFLDPLFSSGLDLLAIGNELVVPRILDDLAGRDVGRDARRASSLYARVVDQYLQLYRGAYGVMGHPRAMMAKIVWDISVYLGFLAPVVRSGRLADEAFMAHVHVVGQGVAALQERMCALLADWAESPSGTPARGWVDQSTFAPLSPLVTRLRQPADGGTAARLGENLCVLEQLALALFAGACEDVGVTMPTGAVNPYAIGLRPERWVADGLTSGSRAAVPDPTVLAAMEAAWLRS